MGQRTETFTTYIDKNGKKHNNVYYHGWGIGRVQLMSVMGNYLAQMGLSKFDLSGSKGDFAREKFKVSKSDFTDIKQVHDIIDMCDNNNGGVVAIVNEQTGVNKIGFVLGWEECYDYNNNVLLEEPCSRFVSFEEWRKKVGGRYVDDTFAEMFLSFCKHFGFSFLGEDCNVEVAKDTQNEIKQWKSN